MRAKPNSDRKLRATRVMNGGFSLVGQGGSYEALRRKGHGWQGDMAIPGLTGMPPQMAMADGKLNRTAIWITGAG